MIGQYHITPIASQVLNGADLPFITWVPFDDPLSLPCFKLKFINSTAADLIIGFGSQTSHDVVEGNSTMEIVSPSGGSDAAFFKKGLVIYVIKASVDVLTNGITMVGYSMQELPGR